MIFRVKAVLSGTHFFFGLKKNQKSVSDRREKNNFKNNIFFKTPLTRELFLIFFNLFLDGLARESVRSYVYDL